MAGSLLITPLSIEWEIFSPLLHCELHYTISSYIVKRKMHLEFWGE